MTRRLRAGARVPATACRMTTTDRRPAPSTGVPSGSSGERRTAGSVKRRHSPTKAELTATSRVMVERCVHLQRICAAGDDDARAAAGYRQSVQHLETPHARHAQIDGHMARCPHRGLCIASAGPAATHND